MKRILFIAACLLILLPSCKKEKPDNNYYVSFKVNGETKSFTGHTFARLNSLGGDAALAIVGAKTDTSFNDYFAIYINNNGNGRTIGVGEYKDTSSNFVILSRYENITNGNQYESGTAVAEDAVFVNAPITNHLKVNLSLIDNKTVRGTFSGDYYKFGFITGTMVTITDGVFYVGLD